MKKKENQPSQQPEALPDVSQHLKINSEDAAQAQDDSTLPVTRGENSIIQDFRRSDWLYNPVVYTQISGDFTLMQQRVFIGVVEKLQDRILDSINEQKRTKQWPTLFSKEEMGENIDLRIDARLLGVPPERYPELKQAL